MKERKIKKIEHFNYFNREISNYWRNLQIKKKSFLYYTFLYVESVEFHQISKTCAFFLRRLSQSKSALTSLRKFCVMLQKISVKTLFLVIFKIPLEAFQINRNTTFLIHKCMKDMSKTCNSDFQPYLWTFPRPS